MNGVLKGVQLMADYLRFLLKVVSHPDQAKAAEAMRDAMTVAKLWLSETVNEAGQVRLGPFAILFSDPWQGSRSSFRALQDKWKGQF